MKSNTASQVTVRDYIWNPEVYKFNTLGPKLASGKEEGVPGQVNPLSPHRPLNRKAWRSCVGPPGRGCVPAGCGCPVTCCVLTALQPWLTYLAALPFLLTLAALGVLIPNKNLNVNPHLMFVLWEAKVRIFLCI